MTVAADVAQVARCTLHFARCPSPAASCQLPIPVAVSSSPRRSQFEFRNSGCCLVAPQQPLPPAHSQLRCNPLFFRSACNPAIDRSIAIYRLCAYQFGQHLRANKTSQGKSQRTDCPIVTTKKKKTKKVAEGKVVSPTKRERQKKRKRQDRRQSNFAYRQLAGIMSLPNVNRIE